MKNRKINFIKLGILLFGISLFLWNCENEGIDINSQDLKEKPKIETFTLAQLESDNTFNNLKTSFKILQNTTLSRTINNTYTPRLVDTLGVTIDANSIKRISYQDYVSYSMLMIDSENTSSNFSNLVIQVHNGISDMFTVRYIVDNVQNRSNQDNARSFSNTYIASGITTDDMWDDGTGGGGGGGNGVPCEGEFVYDNCSAGGSANGHSPALQLDGVSYCSGSPLLYVDFSHCYDIIDVGGWGDIDTNPSDNNNSTGGVGSSSNGGDNNTPPDIVTAPTDPRCPPESGKVMINGVCKCPTGTNENELGICVQDPCYYINLQIQNPNYTQQANELEGKTGLMKETGYKQNKDGSQVALNDTNNGHSLVIPVNSNTVGYMHTHLDDFLTGKIDPKTGDEELKKPIKIFSPADLIKFLQIVKNSKYNGVPTHLVYGTVIASTGNYTLRFTGNIDDIVNLGSANSYSADYKKYFTKKYKNNKERAFLHFLKDKIGINGINLYRIRDNGGIEKKTLKENGKVDTNDCE